VNKQIDKHIATSKHVLIHPPLVLHTLHFVLLIRQCMTMYIVRPQGQLSL